MKPLFQFGLVCAATASLALGLSLLRAEPQAPGQEYSIYFLLHGVIQHTLYHAGQIALSRKTHTAAADPSRAMLRHTVATLAYRAGKALRGAPEAFGDFHSSETSRTPRQILDHLGDLLDWALVTAQGKPSWRDAAPLAFSVFAPSVRLLSRAERCWKILINCAPIVRLEFVGSNFRVNQLFHANARGRTVRDQEALPSQKTIFATREQV